MTHRRDFLKTLGLAAAALPAPLHAVRHAYTEAVEALHLPALRGDDFEALRAQYLLDPGITYLNHASIGTIPRPVHEARQRYLDLCETNPWRYLWSGEWEASREAVRVQAAALLNATSEEVALTHNTTEAFNLLAHGLPLGPGDEVVFSTLNHSGASAPFVHAAETRGYTVTRFPFPLEAVPTMTEEEVLALYAPHLTPATKLLVLPHLDNTVGLRHPVAALAALARSRGVPYVAVDGAQAVGMIPVDVQALGVDLYATSPHKWLQAPKGLGLTYVRRDLQEVLRPFWVTWGQQRWAGTARIYEDYGTRNLPEVLALGDALAFQRRLDPAARAARLEHLWGIARAAAQAMPGVRWRSPETWDMGGALFAVEPVGRPSEAVFEQLYREHGYVFRAFPAEALNTLRLSPNVFTAEAALEGLFDHLAAL